MNPPPNKLVLVASLLVLLSYHNTVGFSLYESRNRFVAYKTDGIEKNDEGVVNFVPIENSVKDEEQINNKPIIGVLAQELSQSMNDHLQDYNMSYSSYIAASYIKTLESAGARVVPVMIDQPQEYYDNLLSSLNGFLFPGGAVSITNTSGYGRAGDYIYQQVLVSQSTSNPLPLWATCLGFEMLVYLAAGRQYPLSPCEANGRADPLYFTEKFRDSKMFRTATEDLIEATQTLNVTTNFHHYCALPQTFSDLNVDADYNVLSTNYDDIGTLYVSTIEHKTYPIFGTQWHPEKPAFEWTKDSIPHSYQAIRLNAHIMEVFVNEARRNMNKFSSEAEEEANLIYNFDPLYAAALYSSSFEQNYYFN